MIRIRPVLALLLTATLCTSGLPLASAAPARLRIASGIETPQNEGATSVEATPEVADNTVIVRFEHDLTPEALGRVYKAADTSAGAVSVIRGDVLSWKVPAGDTVDEFAQKLEDTGQVAYAEPNYLRYPAGYTPPAYAEPNDPAYLDTGVWGWADGSESYAHAKSWWIRDVKGIPAWKKGYTGSDITGKYPLRSDGQSFKVAVIDTGYYTDHPDAGTHVLAGSSDITPVLPSQATGTLQRQVSVVSHGTCVGGLIAAAANNGVGTLGIGNDTDVAIYKVYFGGDGIADDDIIAAIRKAADDGCRVINMSLAGEQNNEALQDAIDYAWGKGCVLVAASGNDSAATVSYPAAMNHVVAVGALAQNGDYQRKRADFSNYGSALDISAPGSWIWGLTKPGYIEDQFSASGYKWWEGTSMASPIVAGGIAWLWRAAPWMSNSQIVALVERTADDLGAAGRDNTYGYGDLNLEAAYNKLISENALLKKPTITVLSEDNARNVKVKWTAVSGYDVRYDVTLDGVELLVDTTATSVTLPYDTSTGEHVISVTAKSSRSWADGSETASVTVYPSAAVPEVTSARYYRGKLLWSTTEDSRANTVTVAIDGAPELAVSGGQTSTASLGLNPGPKSHTATLTVQDESGAYSNPKAVTFIVRPAAQVHRTAASDRYGFASSLSRSEFATATTAVLVGSGSWMDALSAAPLAHVVHGPVLLTSRTSLPSATSTELRRLGVKSIIIVGDTADVSSSLRAALKKRYSVIRISGNGRYETANAVAVSIWKRSGKAIPEGKVVVVGDSFPYAMAASAVAARKGWPLLYTNSTSVPLSTRATLHTIGASNTLVVGGTTSVPDKVKAQLPAPQRISGSPTLAVPTLLASWATANYPGDFSGERIYVASDYTWANGLGVPTAAAEKGGLVLLTTPALTTPVRSYYTTHSEVAVFTRVVASTAAITSSAYDAIKGIVGAP